MEKFELELRKLSSLATFLGKTHLKKSTAGQKIEHFSIETFYRIPKQKKLSTDTLMKESKLVYFEKHKLDLQS